MLCQFQWVTKVLIPYGDVFDVLIQYIGVIGHFGFVGFRRRRLRHVTV